MATFRTKLKQLRDADVRYISLVDRAATRIPFRVLKHDKESKMGIDLTNVFKSDASSKPHVSSLVVFAQKNEAAGKAIQEAIEKYGFKTDVVQKSDEGETVVYAQGTDDPKDVHIVRLSDQTLVSVAGLTTPEGWIGDFIEKNGFVPDLATATRELYDNLQEIVTKSENPQADVEATLMGYANYLSQLAILPANCFKLDEEIVAIVKKCECEPKAKKVEKDTKKVIADAVNRPETEEDRKKRIASHPPAEMAPVDEEDDQKPPPEEEATKSEDETEDPLYNVLVGIEETIVGLSQRFDTMVAEQSTQKKVLDDVVQKADTLNTTLKTTVTAAPASEDRPSQARMRVQKDDDPRTGNFDTAFLRRRR